MIALLNSISTQTAIGIGTTIVVVFFAGLVVQLVLSAQAYERARR